MRSKRTIMMVVFFLWAMAGVGTAGQPYPVWNAETAKKEGTAVSVKGTIKFQGGEFYIVGPEIKGQMRILNPEGTILYPFYRSGRTVAVQGRQPKGAEFLFVEKIDGKAYPGGNGGPYPAGK